MSTPDRTPRHPIRVAAQRTGLTPASLRAWERRYHVVDPGRTEGGQRLYSDRDLHRLTTMRALTEGGRSISMVAALSDEAANALLEEDRGAAVVETEEGASDASNSIDWVDRAYRSLADLDADDLHRTLWDAAMQVGGLPFLDQVVAPLLDRVGEEWERGMLSPDQEHMGSAVIERVLGRLAGPSGGTESGPGMVVATLPGERHGLGAQLVATAARIDGWRVTYLGTDLPPRHIAEAAERIHVAVVAISTVGLGSQSEMMRSLAELRTALNAGVSILVGGRASVALREPTLPAGVQVVDGLNGFRRWCLQRRGFE